MEWAFSWIALHIAQYAWSSCRTRVLFILTHVTSGYLMMRICTEGPHKSPHSKVVRLTAKLTGSWALRAKRFRDPASPVHRVRSSVRRPACQTRSLVHICRRGERCQSRPAGSGKVAGRRDSNPKKDQKTYVFRPEMCPKVAISVQFAPRGANSTSLC